VLSRKLWVSVQLRLCKRLAQRGLNISDIPTIELSEAFAAQVPASLRDLGFADDDGRVNVNGGAIAIGYPPGMSGVPHQRSRLSFR
jgi:acetyl-CoA acetyltransferase